MSPETRTTHLRLSLTLPGSASLGAYQAGAVAALLVLVRRLRSRDVRVDVDAVGGASAGAFVATLFSHCLLTGRDATALLAETWIDEVDMDLLRSGGRRAPLAADRLKERVVTFLEDRSSYPYDAVEPQEQSLILQIGLTSLLGYTSPIESIDGASLPGLSYADWAVFDLASDHEPTAVTEPPSDGSLSVLDAVLASATHPGGFPPRLLDRSADRCGFVDRGITNFPDAGRLWYTDGGLVESSPAGRIIDAATGRADAAPGVRRLHLVVDPRSSGPAPPWNDPEVEPSWFDGLRRSVSIVPTQALHDDLRRVASVNRRLVELERVTGELAERLEAAGQTVDLDDLRSELAVIGDLQGKRPVDIDMISPLLVADGDDERDRATDLLAGDFVGAFGGFLDADIRRSDFALGWASTDRWWDRAGERLAITDDVHRAVAEDLRAARPDDLSEDRILEGSGSDHLGPGGRWRLTALAAQYGRILLGAALPQPGLGPIGQLVDSVRDRLPSAR